MSGNKDDSNKCSSFSYITMVAIAEVATKENLVSAAIPWIPITTPTRTSAIFIYTLISLWILARQKPLPYW